MDIANIMTEFSNGKISHRNLINKLYLSDEEKELASKFWYPNSNEKWIELTKEMAIKYLEFNKNSWINEVKNTLNAKYKINGIMKKCFNNNDYKITKLKKNDYNIMISGECWKHLLYIVNSKYSLLASNIMKKFHNIYIEANKILLKEASEKYLLVKESEKKDIEIEILRLKKISIECEYIKTQSF